MRVFIAMGVAALMAGCAVAPNDTEFAAADFGQYPANFDTVISRYHDTVMKDPESVRIKYLDAPQKGYSFAHRAPVYGYRVCATVNSKNNFGGYTGAHVTTILIRNDRVVQYLVADHSSSYDDAVVKRICDRIVGNFRKPEGAE
jgi:hypothetical protein